MKEKIGLFGGSFDPVHTAHQIIASVVKEEFNLNRVIFIPNYLSPFKKDKFTTEIVHRLEMVRIAISDENRFELSDFEAMKNRPVYTYETIEYFKSLYPDSELYLIIGYDSYKTLSSWKNSSYILENSNIIVAKRSEDGILLNENIRDNIRISKLCPRMDISSSVIREMNAKNLNIKYLVNEKVRNYIIQKNLYTENLNKPVL